MGTKDTKIRTRLKRVLNSHKKDNGRAKEQGSTSNYDLLIGLVRLAIVTTTMATFTNS